MSEIKLHSPESGENLPIYHERLVIISDSVELILQNEPES